MKTSPRFLPLLLLPALVSLPAGSAWSQQREALSELKSARVVERGSHHAKWETVQDVADPISGETISVTNGYTQLEVGLHYQDERGEWQESSEEIEVQPGAAVARRGPHQVRWAANLNTYGAIEFWTPEGEAIRSHVLGLAYFDPATGAHVMIGEVQDSIGAVAGNQVIYEDAFDGVSADLHYTYTKGGFVQDVIVREKLPDPALWGFDPATVQVQVLTEFVALPEPLKELARVSSETLTSTNAPAVRFGAVYQADQSLNFGSMAMTEGRAFGVEDTAQERAVPVRKTLQLFEGGRNILVETLDYVVMEPELETLPENSKPTASLDRKSSGHQTASLRVAPPAPTRQWAAGEAVTDEDQAPLLMARAELPAGRNGYVIDYNLSGTTNNLTLQGDTTYYISGTVTATGVTTIEGGTVVKYTNSTSAMLKIQGTIRCQTAPYRPAVFTAKDDNTVGSTVSGSTGSPSGHYANPALFLDNNTSDLRHLHIRFARQGIYYDSDSGYPHLLSHAQIIKSGYGVISLSPVFHVRNALLNEVVTNFHTTTTSITGHIEHLTTHQASRLNGSGNLTLNVTNSLLIQITNSSSYSGSGNATASSGSAVFQTVGAGAHYLASGSTNRNAGVTNLSTQLRADFLDMTTHPPVYWSNAVVQTPTTLTTVVQRDVDMPDRGYHYAPIDYALYTLIVTNTTLRVEGGAALAQVGGTGIWLQDYSSFESHGEPTRHNHVFKFWSVQEQPFNWGNYGSGGAFFNTYNYTGNPTSLDIRFLSGYSLAGANNIFYFYTDDWEFVDFTLRDSELFGGTFSLTYTGRSGKVLNNLLHRPLIYVQDDPAIEFRNNTVYYGTFADFIMATNHVKDFRDNFFYLTTVSQFIYPVTHDYNGYMTGGDRLTPNASNDTILSSHQFAEGALGGYYLPQGSALIDSGSRNATNAGLYHFTTQVGQTKETNSVVDIGYHYAAVVPAQAELAKSGMSAYAPSTCCGWTADKAINGLTTDVGWHNGNSTNANEYLRIDLGGSKAVGRVGYIPRQGTTPSPLYDGGNNGVFRQYEIYVSDSTSSWGSPVAAGWFNWPNGQERRDIEFSPKTGRYVFFKRIDAYGWYGPYEPNQPPSYGHAQANEVWLYQWNGLASAAIDTDGDTLADYFEDTNGNGTADGSETDWQNYDSLNGLGAGPAVQLHTPLRN